MKFKEVFPSARLTRGILFVPVSDIVHDRDYLDENNTDLFTKGLRILESTDFEHIALSFEGFSFVASMAVGAMIDFQTRMSEQGRHFLIYDLHPKVRVILTGLGLDQHFDIYGLRGHVLKFYRPDGTAASD